VKHYIDTISTDRGLPANGATVQVKLTGTATPATLYSDNGVTPKTNPVTCDSTGQFDFYVADGRYDLVIVGGGSIGKTLTDVEIADISGSGTTTFDDIVADQVTATAFTGPLTGAVTGNVIGNLTGSVTGNVTGTGLSTLAQILSKAPVANVKAFGAVGDGVTDDAVAINAAIAYAFANGSVVYLPRGTYKVNSPIDMTEIKGMTLMGDGAFQDTLTPTSILGNTGNVVLDTLGSSFCNFLNFRIRVESSYTNPSKVGVLQGRSGTAAVYQYAEYNNFENVYVYMDSDPAATARGRVGLYNVGGEHSTYRNCYFLADLPVALAATDVLAVPSPIVGAHSAPTSMTISHFLQCGARAWTNSAYELWNCENIKFEMCYASRQPGSTHNWPIGLNAGCQQIYFSGQLEEWPAVLNLGLTNGTTLSNLYLDVFSVSPTMGLIYTGSTTIVLAQPFIRIRQNGTARSLFELPGSLTVRGGMIFLGTTAGISDTDVTITGGLVIADDATSDTIAVNAASRFTLLKNDGKLGLMGTTTTTIGAAGGAAALPATPLGYITVNIAGTDRKIPFYNV
jgi:hypothetical protein